MDTYSFYYKERGKPGYLFLFENNTPTGKYSVTKQTDAEYPVDRQNLEVYTDEDTLKKWRSFLLDKLKDLSHPEFIKENNYHITVSKDDMFTGNGYEYVLGQHIHFSNEKEEGDIYVVALDEDSSLKTLLEDIKKIARYPLDDIVVDQMDLYIGYNDYLVKDYNESTRHLELESEMAEKINRVIISNITKHALDILNNILEDKRHKEKKAETFKEKFEKSLLGLTDNTIQYTLSTKMNSNWCSLTDYIIEFKYIGEKEYQGYKGKFTITQPKDNSPFKEIIDELFINHRKYP